VAFGKFITVAESCGPQAYKKGIMSMDCGKDSEGVERFFGKVKSAKTKKKDCGMKTDLAKVNQYDKDGYPDGPWELYHGNGEISSKGEYKNGMIHGPWEDYYDNGQLCYKSHYRHGSAHGLWELYHVDNHLICKGEYKKSKRIGLWYDDRY
jgi:antitoxin component YwqK of YwqJK toxin-antitoxin module